MAMNKILARQDHPPAARFLARGLAGGGAALGGTALAAPQGPGNPANLPPNVADWTQDARRRRRGAALRQAREIRGNTSSAATCRGSPPRRKARSASRRCTQIDGIITPNGLCFERHHSGIAEVNPTDYRLMIHGLVDKPLIFTLDDIKRMPRVNRAYFCECAANSGMEWRGAQLNGAQYTHGMVHCVMYTGVPLKVLLQRSGPQAQGEMAADGRRRRRGDDALAAACRRRSTTRWSPTA